MNTLNVQGKTINVIQSGKMDFISLTDMIKANDGDFFISDWLRNRNTIEYLGIGETIYNPDFNYGEFATIKSKAGLNSYKLNVMDNPEKSGNIRDEVTPEQLVVLSNLESINALFIQQELSSSERLIQLNKVAITQMKSLLTNTDFKKLK